MASQSHWNYSRQRNYLSLRIYLLVTSIQPLYQKANGKTKNAWFPRVIFFSLFVKKQCLGNLKSELSFRSPKQELALTKFCTDTLFAAFVLKN